MHHDAAILELALRFRAAIEASNFEKMPIGFRDFPVGSCGDAALLLAKYLQENGHIGFAYVCGMRNGHSHAWLQRDDLVVDITGDQFEDNEECVFVGRRSSWHDTFEIDDEHPPDVDLYDERTRSDLGSAYAHVCRHLV